MGQPNLFESAKILIDRKRIASIFVQYGFAIIQKKQHLVKQFKSIRSTHILIFKIYG